MMHTGWSSEKKKVGIGRLIDWLVGIPSLREVSETNDEAISLKT